MINYFFIQLKSKLLGKKNLLIFMAVIIFSVGLTYLYHQVTDQNIYKVAIVDLDQSDTSKKIIGVLEDEKEIDLILENQLAAAQKKLKRGDYHILYTIKNGFEAKLMAGEYKDVIGYSKESSMQMTAWLNDFITLKVLKEWAYYDLYNIISKATTEPFTLREYKKAYEENLEKNEIITLKLNSLSVKEKATGHEKKIFLSIISVFMMLVTMSYGKDVLNEREMNIVNRLKVSGISEVQYLMNKGMILWIYLLTIFLISTIGLILLGVLKDVSIINDGLAVTTFIGVNYLVTLLLVYLLNEKGKYLLVTQGYILFSILMSSDLFKGNLPLVNQVKGIFPLTYLFEMIL